MHRRVNSAAGLQLFIYTPRCVYDDGWDEFTVMARGLICLILAPGSSWAITGRDALLSLEEKIDTSSAAGELVFQAVGKVVATPFPKFFNVGERRGDVPDLPFEAFNSAAGLRSSMAASSLPSIMQEAGAPPRREHLIPSKQSGRRPGSMLRICPHLHLARPTCSRRSTPRTASSCATKSPPWSCWRHMMAMGGN